MAIQLGDTFYWHDGGHLWAVISNPSAHCGEFVTANITKDVFRAGKECELNIGEHPWIKLKSYVSFGDAKKWGPKEEVNLVKQLALGTIKMHSPLSQTTLAKIVAAGKISKALADELKTYL